MNVISLGRSRQPKLVMLLASMMLMLSNRESAAQSKPVVDQSPTVVPSTGSEDETTSRPNAVKQIPSSEQTNEPRNVGKRKPGEQPLIVVNKKQFERFQKWQKSQETPEFNLIDLSLRGEVKGGRALLTVTVNVKIKRENEFVLVPLRMNNAILLKSPKHKPPVNGGDVWKDNENDDPKDGHRWWFKGKGIHRLTFPISVLVHTRRIQLPLPSPRAAASVLKLRVPISRIAVRSPEGSSYTVNSLGSVSKIEMHGLGHLLDLTWQPVPSEIPFKLQLQVDTLILVDLTTELIVLEATQTIRAQQGSTKQFSVRLPMGFELNNIEGEQYQKHDIDDDNSNRVIVHLKDRMASRTEEPPVTLKWTLQSEFPQQNAGLVLTGFEVEDALHQRGYLAINAVDGYRVSKRRTPEGSISRVGISKLRDYPELRTLIADGQISRAYQFLQQPFQLVLDLQKIEPYFTVEPHLFLKLSQNQADLEAHFRFYVFRGTLREIKLAWPSWQEEKWVLPKSDDPNLVRQIVPNPNDAAAGLTVRLVEKKTRVNGVFEVRIKTRRPINPDDQPFQLTLPSAAASNRKSPILVVASAENVTVDEFVHLERDALRPLSVSSLPKPTNFPEEFRKLVPDGILRIASSQLTFEVKATVHKQRIRANTIVSAKLENAQIVVNQRFLYNVAYVPLLQVRLLIPNALRNPIHFSLEDNSEATTSLIPDFTQLEVESSREALFNLDKARLSEFEILARFTVDVPKELVPGTKISEKIPLIRSSDISLESSNFELPDTEPVMVSVTESAWTKQIRVDDTELWIADGGQQSIPLTFEHSLKPVTQDFAIVKAAIRTNATQRGPAQSHAFYLIEGNVKTLVVTFQHNIQTNVLPNFWWDGIRLGRDEIVDIDRGEFRLDVANLKTNVEYSQPADRHRLMIEFSSKRALSFDWTHEHNLSAPQFPSNVRIAQTIWEVVLPFNQYLLTNPRELTPQYYWRRNGFFFSRVLNPAYKNLIGWVFSNTQSVADEIVDRPKGNAYQFGCFGPTGTLGFRSMNQQLIVILGSGLALIVGFVLLKLPATRHVLTFLSLGFVVAIVSLWYAESVQLLVQPALLGLILAVVAAFIDNLFKRRRTAAVVQLASPSDLVAPSSLVDHPAAVIGSDGPNVHHQPSNPLTEPLSASKSGTGV